MQIFFTKIKNSLRSRSISSNFIFVSYVKMGWVSDEHELGHLKSCIFDLGSKLTAIDNFANFRQKSILIFAVNKK
jgi:hypothetical protein